MIERDILVVLVAIGLGSFLIYAAMVDRAACYEFWLVKRIEARFGRPTAKNVVIIAGVLIVLLGIYVLMFPSKTHRANEGSPAPLAQNSPGPPLFE